MEKGSNKQMNTALVYGSITGLAVIICSVIFYIIGESLSETAKYLNYLIVIAGLILGIKNYRDKELGGYISYGHALGTGTLISLISALIFTTYFYIFIKYIDPDFIQKIIEKSRDAMLEKGLDEEKVDQIMQKQHSYMTPWSMFFFGILGNVFMGFIFTLIISIFLKKRDENFESNFR